MYVKFVKLSTTYNCMKYIIVLITLIALNLLASEVEMSYYPLKYSGKMENVVFYDSGKFETNNIVIGKTYQFNKCQLDFNTETNSFLDLALSDDTLIHIDEGSQFKFHTFLTSVENTDDLPTIARISNQNYICSLMVGMVDIVNSSTNGTFLLQTPRITIVLKKGKYRVVVQGKTTVIAVLEGKSVIYKIIESKELEIKENSFAHVTTYFSLSGKGIDVLNNGRPTANVRPIQLDDVDKIKSSCDDLTSSKSKILFSIVDKKVLGIKIR